MNASIILLLAAAAFSFLCAAIMLLRFIVRCRRKLIFLRKLAAALTDFCNENPEFEIGHSNSSVFNKEVSKISHQKK